jgi:hypothetical protein
MDTRDTYLDEQSLDKPAGKKVSGLKRFARTFMIVTIAILIFCIYWFFFNKYGNGERTGVLVKITHKGNVFKTDEGELWLSCRQVTNPEKFYFSVASDSIAKALMNLQDECVQVTYTQYRAKLPWRGDTKYIVTGVIPIQKKSTGVE